MRLMETQQPRGRKPRVDKAQVLSLLAQEWSQSEIARHFGVTPQAINKIVSKAREGAEAEQRVQPVAPDEAIEIVPPPVVRSIIPHAPPPLPTGASSEWRGVGLAQTLGDRYRQLEIIQGAQAAHEFAIREAWTLTRQGTSIESISQQFDLPLAKVETFVAEARTRALARIDTFDPRLSLSAALSDIELARRAAMLTLMSAKASEGARALARDALIRVAARETELAATIAQYRASQGLNGDDTGADDLNRLDAWMTIPKRKGHEG